MVVFVYPNAYRGITFMHGSAVTAVSETYRVGYTSVNCVHFDVQHKHDSYNLGPPLGFPTSGYISCSIRNNAINIMFATDRLHYQRVACSWSTIAIAMPFLSVVSVSNVARWLGGAAVRSWSRPAKLSNVHCG